MSFLSAERGSVVDVVDRIGDAALVAEPFKLASLAPACALAKAVLDELRFGVIVTDANARLVSANRHATGFLQQGAGLSVTRSGILVAGGGHNKALRTMIALSAAPGLGKPGPVGSLLTVPLAATGRDCTLQFSSIAPEAARCAGLACAALILVSDRGAGLAPCAADLQAAYGLTAAEARVAHVAFEYDSVGEMACALSLSANTVKSHLKAIYAKAQVSGKAQFVRRVIAKLGH